MRRSVSLVTLVAVMVATMVLSGAALAEPSPPSDPPSDSGNPSCFGAFARLAPDGSGPGELVSGAATTLAEPSTPPGSGTDEVARNIGPVQHVRQGACPADYPLQQEEG